MVAEWSETLVQLQVAISPLQPRFQNPANDYIEALINVTDGLDFV